MSCSFPNTMWQVLFTGLLLLVAKVTSTCEGDPTGFNCQILSSNKEISRAVLAFDRPIPQWLTGTLIRNGPGKFENGRQSVGHVFDGFAKLASWTFLPNGTAFFSTKFVESGFYKDTLKSDHLAPYALFAPPIPRFSIADKFRSMENGLDNLNVNIVDLSPNKTKPQFAVFSDFWQIYQISGKDLSTVGKIHPKLDSKNVNKIDLSSSAHPVPEPGKENSKLTFLVKQHIGRTVLVLVRMTSIEGRTELAEWEVDGELPYMHSFAVTESKVVLVTGQFTMRILCVVFKTPVDCMTWQADKPSTAYVYDLKKGAKLTIPMKQAIFPIHHINAYDVTDTQLIMDVVAYDNPDVLKKLLLMEITKNETLREKYYERPQNKRIFLDIGSKSAKISNFSTNNPVTDGADMPSINENFRRKEYCYFYGMNNFANGKTQSSSAVLKKNMCKNGKVEGKFYVDNHYPSEPIFVPNPEGKDEDDGVLLTPFLRGPEVISYISIADAKTMKVIAKADLPVHIPMSLHGHFFKDYYG